jgi:hypothetical protein
MLLRARSPSGTGFLAPLRPPGLPIALVLMALPAPARRRYRRQGMRRESATTSSSSRRCKPRWPRRRLVIGRRRATSTCRSSRIVSQAIASDEVIDILAAAGLKNPDISILSDQFLAEVRRVKHRSLAVELLRKLLAHEVRVRSQQNLVQVRSLADLLEQSVRRYQNRAIEAAQVIEELIQLAKGMRAVEARGEESWPEPRRAGILRRASR